jgi:polyhydroxyalkanoate synthesis regulator phasin
VTTGSEQYEQALTSLWEMTRIQTGRAAVFLAKQGEVQAEQVGRVAGRLAKQAEVQAEQGEVRAGWVSRIVRDLVRRTRGNREMVSRLIEPPVKWQLAALGLATRDEVARLQQRVHALEQAAERSSRPASARTRAASSRARTVRTSSRPSGGAQRRRYSTEATSMDDRGATESASTGMSSGEAGTGSGGA